MTPFDSTRLNKIFEKFFPAYKVFGFHTDKYIDSENATFSTKMLHFYYVHFYLTHSSMPVIEFYSLRFSFPAVTMSLIEFYRQQISGHPDRKPEEYAVTGYLQN